MQKLRELSAVDVSVDGHEMQRYRRLSNGKEIVNVVTPTYANVNIPKICQDGRQALAEQERTSWRPLWSDGDVLAR